MAMEGGSGARDSVRVEISNSRRHSDIVAIEEPLSLVVSINEESSIPLGILMRTPGNDTELIYGFLFSEGIISSSSDVLKIHVDSNNAEVHIRPDSVFDPENYVRRTTMSSSCGVCGRSTISDMLHLHAETLSENISLDYYAFSANFDKMSDSQELFQQSGGTHACASFTEDGDMVDIFEDVGRHNAMDKLVGSHLISDSAPPSDCILVVSGRASFDLVQKSIRSGFAIMLAIGAPSSLAVDLANEHGLTLACFCKESSMSIFSGLSRVVNRATNNK